MSLPTPSRLILILGTGLFPMAAAADLQDQIRAIAADAHGQVSVACSLPGSTIHCDFHPKAHPPMWSVFKLPLAVTMLHLIEEGKWTPNQAIRFRKSDRILPFTVSPLQEQYPDADVDVPLIELLRLTVVESDNAAADILLRSAGGPIVVNRYLGFLGVAGFHLQDDEAAMDKNPLLQYRNWFEPAGAVQFLRLLADHSPLTQEHTDLLMAWMRDTPRGASRLKGRLPQALILHKPGSSGSTKGFTAAWNDIGLISLPNGRRLAIAVFVTDSTADEATRDSVISRIAEAAYEAASGKSK